MGLLTIRTKLNEAKNKYGGRNIEPKMSQQDKDYYRGYIIGLKTALYDIEH